MQGKQLEVIPGLSQLSSPTHHTPTSYIHTCVHAHRHEFTHTSHPNQLHTHTPHPNQLHTHTPSSPTHHTLTSYTHTHTHRAHPHTTPQPATHTTPIPAPSGNSQKWPLVTQPLALHISLLTGKHSLLLPACSLDLTLLYSLPTLCQEPSRSHHSPTHSSLHIPPPPYTRVEGTILKAHTYTSRKLNTW